VAAARTNSIRESDRISSYTLHARLASRTSAPITAGFVNSRSSAAWVTRQKHALPDRLSIHLAARLACT